MLDRAHARGIISERECERTKKDMLRRYEHD
jgi:hypothetical protein